MTDGLCLICHRNTVAPDLVGRCRPCADHIRTAERLEQAVRLQVNAIRDPATVYAFDALLNLIAHVRMGP